MDRIVVGGHVALLAVLAALAVANTAAAQCAEGRVANEQTQGRCCWPGQAWNPDTALCTGVPGCPAGRVAQGEDCVLAAGVGAAPGATTAVQAQPAGQPAAQPTDPNAVPAAPVGYGQPQQQGYGQQYQAVQVAPAGEMRTEQRVNKALLVPGIIMFSVGYGIAVVSAVIAEYGWIAIPIAGPFILMGELNSGDPTSAYVGLAAWGIVQAAGVLMFILGLTLKRDVQVRADLGEGRSIALQPWETPGGGGLQLIGEF